MYQSELFNDPSNTDLFKLAIENVDFIGATVRIMNRRLYEDLMNFREESGI